MRASPSDRNTDAPSPQGSGRRWGTVIVGLCVLIALAYLVLPELLPEEEVEMPVVSEPEVPEIDPVPTPEIPQQPAHEATPFVLPSLDDSDTEVATMITQLSPNSELLTWLKPDHLIRRGVGLIDGLSRGIMLQKLASVHPPAGKFLVAEDGDTFWLDPANYNRYSYLADMVHGLDVEKLVAMFHLLRPLLEQAYGELGTPADQLDSAIINAIDKVLSAPTIDGPIALKKLAGQYRFTDPELELLPPLQKQLLRMGPDTTRKIQSKLRTLRARLMGPVSTESGTPAVESTP